MKKHLILSCFLMTAAFSAQTWVSGHVVSDSDATPISNVSISASNKSWLTTTDKKGNFTFKTEATTLQITISKTGYESQTLELALPIQNPLTIVLKEKTTTIEEVQLTTGYQKIPKERSTGSFTSVSNRELNVQVSTSILSRLETIASGIMVDRGTGQGTPQIMVRGLSTIQGPKAPLIVVDNFPYEGPISNIDPNSVENITILKDAAASSIWGARAANGVIIITTKKPKANQAVALSFSTLTSISPKPNLEKIPVMKSADYIDMEQELFKRGFYNADINSTLKPVLSPVVDLLNKERKGLITSTQRQAELQRLKNIDLRDQFKKYMYRPLENRQYALSASGGSASYSWISSLSYDENSGNLEEKYKRLNFRLVNNWQPTKKLNVFMGVNFLNTKSQSGRSAYGTVTIKNNAVPYMELADEFGNPKPVFKNYNQDFKNSFNNGKILDWNYYPLTDWQHSISKSNSNELTINTGANLKLIQGLDADVKYQLMTTSDTGNTLNDLQSYFTRDLINSFTTINKDGSVTNNIPLGSVFSEYHRNQSTHNLRSQLNFNRKWNRHEVYAIAGSEIRSANTKTTSLRYYGFNENNLALGSVDYVKRFPLLSGGSSFIANVNSLRETNANFLSFYTNASYTFDKRFTLSASARKDASNLFGLTTNDQWNPFWSAGLAWSLSNEKFYNLPWLPKLKLRASYGFNGNINPAMVAVTTIASLGTSVYTGTQIAKFNNYYNPQLKWETIRMTNWALDFASSNDRISGSIEFFQKKGENLFGNNPLDYTTGITSLTWNVASMQGHGWDLELKTKNIQKVWSWSTAFNLSTYHDKVTDYYLKSTSASSFVLPTVPISGLAGKPVYAMMGYKWAGLDPQTGDPRGYLNGEISKDYAKITGVYTKIEELQYFGSAIPTLFGSLNNTFLWKNLALDIGISYKMGYYFRKPTIHYTNLFRDWATHSDYGLRWQKPGDEATTNVPSNLYKTDSSRDAFYNGASIHIEKADHIRLQYINLSYNLENPFGAASPLKNMQLFTNLANLGILWQKSKSGIDPDFNRSGNIPIPLQLTLGLKTQF